MVKKKDDNKVLYIGIAIAVITVSSFSVYTQTDIFSGRGTEPVNVAPVFDAYVPPVLLGMELDIINDELLTSGRTIFGGTDFRYWAEGFTANEPLLSGFGIYIEKLAVDPLPLKICFCEELDYVDQLNCLAYGELDSNQIVEDVLSFAYIELETPIQLTPGETYYIVLYTDEPSGVWRTRLSTFGDYEQGNIYVYTSGNYWNNNGWETDDLGFYTYYYVAPCQSPYGQHNEIKCGEENQHPEHKWQCSFQEWSDVGWDAECIAPPYEMSLWWMWALIIAIIGIVGYNYLIRKKK